MHELQPSRPWYRELTGYHWFVLFACTLGWMFDCLDQQLFNLARKPAVTELCHLSPTDPLVEQYSTAATAFMLIGWATGGILFGVMGDRIGRAKTMVWTILAYSIFTGLSGFAVSIWDFMAYRFLMGLGVGGQFAVGVSLVAEVMPDRARPHALGLLQALSAVGNISAALINMFLTHLAERGVVSSAWRWVFIVSIVPAVLTVWIVSHLKEPERWKQAVDEGKQQHKKAGSLAELFGEKRWRRRTIVGMILASSGVIGLWAIGFYSIDLNQSVFRKQYNRESRDAGQAELDQKLLAGLLQQPDRLAEVRRMVKPQNLLSIDNGDRDPERILTAMLALESENQPISEAAALDWLDRDAQRHGPQTAEERARRHAYLAKFGGSSISIDECLEKIDGRNKSINGAVGWWASITSMLFNIGAFFGVYAFSRVTARLGRRVTFAIAFVAAMISTAVAFLFMDTQAEVFWMVPLMGFCQLSLFGGYAIYFPELFPTRLRSTGTSLCYNIARFVAATGPIGLGWLASGVFGGFDEPIRYAGVAMCSVFLIGLAVLPFAPETKGQPLPE
jgi:MFS family permease